MALVTAEQFGLPEEVIERAKALSNDASKTCRATVSPAETTGDLIPDSQIVQIVEEITAQNIISIPAYWNVPAYFDGISSVYVLELSTSPPSFYIGESDTLQNRIKQHRAKGGPWAGLKAVAVISASSKYRARTWEIAASGVDIMSTSDGRSIRSSLE
jgi:hypothetical protein